MTSLAAALSVVSCAAQAEDGKLDVSLEVRARVEAVDGQFRPGIATSDAALMTRANLFAEYDAGPVRIGGEIMDSRAFFERRHSSIANTEVNALEPIQAYVSTDFSKAMKLTAGRFTMNLGSRRLIARNQFRNAVNAFTGVQAVLGNPKTEGATLFWMIPLYRLPDETHRIQDDAFALDRERGGPRFFGALGHVAIGEPTAEAYLYRLAEHDARSILTRDRRLWTVGGRIIQNPHQGRMDFEVEGAYQWGRARQTNAPTDTLDREVAAGFIHAEAGYSWDGRWHPRTVIGFDFASGDGSSQRYTRFDFLYGARGFDYGPSSLYGALQRANIVSPFVRGEVKPGKRSDLGLTVRPLWLASASDQFAVTTVRDPAGAAGSFAGVQVDARVRRTLIPDRLKLAAGAVLLAKGRFLRDAANAPDTGDTRYGFVEVTANF